MDLGDNRKGLRYYVVCEDELAILGVEDLGKNRNGSQHYDLRVTVCDLRGSIHYLSVRNYLVN